MEEENRNTYIETFDHGAGGWIADRDSPLPIWDGVAYCYSPWFLDSNHAPPGAGYLHLLSFIHTSQKYVWPEFPDNRFVKGKFSRDLTNAKVTLRLRGEIDLKGAELLILVQAETMGTMTDPVVASQKIKGVDENAEDLSLITTNSVLTSQPIPVTRDWSEPSVVLYPDENQWTCLGSRHSKKGIYGYAPVKEVLKDVNVDIIFVLFPLTVVPLIEVEDMHKIRAGRDYPVDRSALPKGLVMIDTIKIEYP